MEKDKLIDEYIDTIEENKKIFSKQLYEIITKNSNFSGIVGVRGEQIDELEFSINKDSLKIEKIIAPGKGKEIMFLILFKAFENGIDKITLKAEPLRLMHGLNFKEAKNKLINFYGYFLFKLTDNLGNMEFNLKYISERDLKILVNRLKEFLSTK